jgi:hypothetical protein
MAKETKQVTKFKTILKEIYARIKDKKFREAVSLYYRVDKEFKALPEKQKTKDIKNDMHTLYKELSLYLRINEAYVFAQEGNLVKLRKELESIHDSVYDMEQSDFTKPLFDYVTQHYSFCLDIYTIKATEKEFLDLIKLTQKQIDGGKITAALKHYSQLLVLYNKLMPYLEEAEKVKHYYKIKELFKHIAIYRTLHEPKKTTNSAEAEAIEEKPVKQKESPKQNVEFKDDFKEMHEMLDKGDIERAKKILENL